LRVERAARAEEGSMGKGHKVSCSSSTSKCSVSVMLTCGANVKLPKFRSMHEFALENDGIVMANGHRGGGESSNMATGITELANRQEWLCGKLGNNVAMVSCKWKAWEVKVCLMG